MEWTGGGGGRAGFHDGTPSWFSYVGLSQIPAPAWSCHQKAWPHLVSSPDHASEGGLTCNSKQLRSLPWRFLGPLPAMTLLSWVPVKTPSWIWPLLAQRETITNAITFLVVTNPALEFWDNNLYLKLIPVQIPSSKCPYTLAPGPCFPCHAPPPWVAGGYG